MAAAGTDEDRLYWAGAGTVFELPLAWRVSGHARRLFALALSGLALALVTGRPALVAVAAPALVLLCAPRGARPPSVRLSLRPSAQRVYEGEQVSLEAKVDGLGSSQLDVLLHPGEGAAPVQATARAHGGRAAIAFQMAVWGRRSPGVVELAFTDRSRLFACRRLVLLPEVTCYPAPGLHRRAPVLGRPSARSGDHAARSAGDGSEFWGVREYVSGDRQRSINWGATTRRGRLQVNMFAAERSQDVVLVVDATADVGTPGESPLDLALRGSLGIARTYLQARDRVGMVVLGGSGQWTAPAAGKRQYHRLMELLIEQRGGWAGTEAITRLPRAALPPGASVVALSPLLDPRLVEALGNLRERNFSVVVVDVLNSEPRGPRGRLDRLGRRIWKLEREALVFALRELGIPVTHWDGRGELVLPGPARRKLVGAVRQ